VAASTSAEGVGLQKANGIRTRVYRSPAPLGKGTSAYEPKLSLDVNQQDDRAPSRQSSAAVEHPGPVG